MGLAILGLAKLGLATLGLAVLVKLIDMEGGRRGARTKGREEGGYTGKREDTYIREGWVPASPFARKGDRLGILPAA